MLLPSLHKVLYDARLYAQRLYRALMPEEYSDDRLVFRLSSDDAIDLEALGDGFGGLARQFRRHLDESGVDPAKVQSKLYVTDLRTGSIEFEIGTALALYMVLQGAADGFVIWADFYNKLKQTFDYLTGNAARPKWYRRQDAGDFDKFLRTIAGKKGAALRVRRARYHQKSGRRETLAEFDFTEQDVANAHMKLGADLSDFDANADEENQRTHKLETHVP